MLITSADLDGSCCSSQWHLYHLPWIFCLQLLAFNTLISLVDFVTVLVDCCDHSKTRLWWWDVFFNTSATCWAYVFSSLVKKSLKIFFNVEKNCCFKETLLRCALYCCPSLVLITIFMNLCQRPGVICRACWQLCQYPQIRGKRVVISSCSYPLLFEWVYLSLWVFNCFSLTLSTRTVYVKLNSCKLGRGRKTT